MLTLLKLVRNLFKQLKSDLTPSQLAVGAALGALAGLTPFGLHLVLLFTIALLLNCSMAACLFSFGALKPVGLALGGLSFKTGTALLSSGDDPGAYGSLIAALSHAPVLAFMGFDRYVVAGGYAIAVPVAIALGVAVRFGVAAYRTSMAAKLADAAWYQAALTKWYFRLFKWVVAGKVKEAVEPKKRFLLLRPFRAYMIVFVPALYVGLSVGGGLYAQAAINGIAAGTLSKALGVQCSFGKIDYSFFGQRLAFENFQLPDPSNTGQDMVRIGAFEADLGFVSLLSRRLHIEKLSLRDVASSVIRTSDGKLNVTRIPAAAPRPDAPAGEQAAWQEWLAWLTEKGKDVDWTEMWNKFQGYRKKSAEEKAKAKPGDRPALAYDPELRWEPARRDPLVRVDLAEIRNLRLNVSGLPSLTSVDAAGAQLSTDPGWNGLPLVLKGTGKLVDGKSGTIEFSFTIHPPRSEAEIKIAQVPLAEFKGLYEKSLPVVVVAGRATVSAKGGVASGAVDLPVNLQIDGLQVAAKPGETKILGLDAQTSAYAIQGINAYGEKLPIVVGAAVKGTLDDPEVQAKMPFLEIAKKGLEMLGKKELQKYIDQLGGEVDALKKAGTQKLVPLEGDFKNVQEAVKKGDVTGVQEAVKKAQSDVKAIPDVKKDVKDALDLFKKKK